MKSSFPSLLCISCCIFFLFSANVNANEAKRLRAWTKSRLLHQSNPSYVPNAEDAAQRFSLPIAAPQKGLMEADKVHALPGQPGDASVCQYAGYVTVEPKAGRALFYYFVEATHDSHIKPLVLWLNGGPGCSSIGNGLLLELGPFFVNKDGKTLYKNEYAWNNEANMLFLESPAGVGFSYSNRTSDYLKSGDKATAVDNYAFLINWLERFPQYKGRDFYITGESYGGHYIPELANTIMGHNRRNKEAFINLKGVAIGNAYLDSVMNTKGVYDYYFAHALISPQAHHTIKKECDFVSGNFTFNCVDTLNDADYSVGDLDPYAIYAPICLHDTNSSISNEPRNPADPCGDFYIQAYLNLHEVQKAIHANTTGLRGLWQGCSDIVWSNWSDAPSLMLPVIRKLISGGIRMWLYSGDTDSVVPFTSTQYSLDMLKLPITTPWRAWYTNREVGGYVVGYKGLVFATVRGAGHMVPTYQPERALTLFRSFLNGTLPPVS